VIQEYIDQPERFRALSLEEQLTIIADIILYFADKKTEALINEGKTRVDSSTTAQSYYNREKYWENVNMNLKKLAELEVTKLRRGI
jgi:hypothetical protein